MKWLIFITLNAALNFNQYVTTKIVNSGIWIGTGTTNYANVTTNRYGTEYAIPVDLVNYYQIFTQGQIDSAVYALDSSFISGTVAVADSLAKVTVKQKAAVVASLKSTGYKSLQGITVGATLTAAQLQAAAWISLYNAGSINPATNKIDSLENYIK
jgi:hypothetical protein